MKSGAGSIVLRISISFLAIGLIVFSLKDKLHEAVHILRSDVDWKWFVFAIATYVLGLAVLAVRMQCVFRIQDIHINYKESFYLNFVGLFFNLFFPSAVGGDIAKAYYAYKHSGKKLESTTSVILDRLMGFVAMILMALVAVLVFNKQLDDPRIDQLVYLFLGIMIVSIFFFGSKRFARIFKFFKVLVPSEKLKNKISSVYYAIHGYREHKLAMLWCIFLSFCGQSCFIMVHYLATRSLGITLSPWLFFILIPVVSIVSMAPSIGGLGVREAGLIYLFKRFIPSERALALSLLLDIIIYSFSLIAGIVFSLGGGLKKKVIHEMEELSEPV